MKTHLVSLLKDCNTNLLGGCIVANLPSFLIGYCLAWAYVAIPQLDEQPDCNPLKEQISPYQTLLITILIPVGAVPGSLFSRYIGEKRDRKMALVLSSLFVWIGLAVVYFSMYISYILIGRLICGIGIGGSITVIPLYLSEISEDSNRGSSIMLLGLSIIFGTLITHLLNLVVRLNELNLIFFVIAFFFTLVVDWLLPESYHWLLCQDRREDTEDYLKRMKSCSKSDLTSQLAVVNKYIAGKYKNEINFTSLFKTRDTLKNLHVSCGLMLLQQVIGVGAILLYIQRISNRAEDIPPHRIGVISIIQFLTGAVSTSIIDQIGRRSLLLSSTIGCGISLTILGFQAISEWLETVGILLLASGYAMGLGPIPFVILGEIFRPPVDAAASAVTICFASISAIFTTSVTMSLLIVVSETLLFRIMTGICFLGGLWIYIYVPDTKRRNFENMENFLQTR